ncbi:MAG: hypothetical protein JXR63_09165 [Spirochaetales bacterium]|nr:hypothetical protein [Spirochaetales bacterium]
MDGFYDPEAATTYIESYSTVKMAEDFTPDGQLSQIMVAEDFIYGVFTAGNYHSSDTYWRILKFSKSDKTLIGEVNGLDYTLKRYNIWFTLEKDSSGNEIFLLLQKFDDQWPLDSYKILIYDKEWNLINSSPTFYMKFPNFSRGDYSSISVFLVSDNYLILIYVDDHYDDYSSQTYGSLLIDPAIVEISTGVVREVRTTDNKSLRLENFARDGEFIYTTADLNLHKYRFIEDSVVFEYLSSFYYGAVSLSGKFEEGGSNSDCLSIHSGKAFFYKNNYDRNFWTSCGRDEYSKTLYALNLETQEFDIAIWGSSSFTYGSCAGLGWPGISGNWYPGKRFFMNGDEIISSFGEIFVPK